jgi:hypothetical protein
MDDPIKGKQTAVAKYKKMKQPVADSTELSPSHPLMVEKKDGSIGQWGNPLTDETPAKPPVKKMPVMSDKARSLSNTYSTARDNPTGPAIPSQKKSNNYF